MDRNRQIAEMLNVLETDNLDDRVTAIQALGEIGDAEALQRLRERMKLVSREHYALYVAIGKRKRKLHSK
jgi:HEAT repeat protein